MATVPQISPLLVDQTSTSCRMGQLDDSLNDGKTSAVLKQFGQAYPDPTIEVTNWGTGKFGA